jgi:hypothetical protein
VAKLRAQDWVAISIELVIVTVGVIIAAAQQWAKNVPCRASWKATTALRAELSEHYGYAVEFRAVYPCLQTQVSQLRDRVLKAAPP